MALCRIQPIAGGAEDALRALPRAGLVAAALPLSPVRRQLLVKDVKVFLRDVSQWVQLLPLLALVLLYLYNFQRARPRAHPVHERVHQEHLRVHQSRHGGIRDGDRRGAIRLSGGVGRGIGVLDHPNVADLDARLPVVEVLDGALPVLLFTEALTIAANQLLGVDPFLKVVAAGAIVFLTFALVGLATGLGARYPRFDADATQAAGSYGGVMFMIARRRC